MDQSIAAPSQELIFLDPDDDLATVRAKLESTPADEIYLVVPRNASILRSPLEFRILGRLAGELSSETIIVSSDAHRRWLARQEGFRTKGSLHQLRHLMSPRSGRGLFGLLFDWIPAPSPRTGLLAVTLMAAVFAFTYVVLPEMRVTLSPKADTLTQPVDLSVDTNALRVDPLRRTLPGRKVEQRIEARGAVQTSGTSQVGRSKSLGEVQFMSLRNDDVRLPKGTIVMSESGIRFATEGEVTIPARARTPVRTGIGAVDPGSHGNVQPRTITKLEDQQRFAGLQVQNLLATSGGADREARVVTEADIGKLRAQLLQQAREEAVVAIQQAGGSETAVLREAIRVQVIEERFDQEVGSPAERVTGRIAATATAIGFNKDEVARMVTQVMAPRIDPQFQFVGGQARLGQPEVVSADEQAVKIRVQGSAVIVRTLDTDSLEAQLRGKSLEEARAILSRVQGLAVAPRVELSPNWSTRAFRVNVVVAAPR